LVNVALLHRHGRDGVVKVLREDKELAQKIKKELGRI